MLNQLNRPKCEQTALTSFTRSDLANTFLTPAKHWQRQTVHCACQTCFSLAPAAPVVFGSRHSPIFCYHLLWQDKTSLCITGQIPAVSFPEHRLTCTHVQHARDNLKLTCLQLNLGFQENLPKNYERKKNP